MRFPIYFKFLDSCNYDDDNKKESAFTIKASGLEDSDPQLISAALQ